MNFLRKYQVHILAGLLTFFLIYIALGFGSSLFVKGSPNDSIIDVDGEKVPLRLYWIHYNRAIDQAKTLDKAGRDQKRDETIRDLVQSVVFRQQVENFGIRVPDQQVAQTLTQIPQFQSGGHFNPQLYMQALQNQAKMSPQDFEEEQRLSIGFFKLRWMIQSAIKVTDKEMDLNGQYPEFAKTNQVEQIDIHDEKTGKITGHKKRERPEAEVRALYRKKLWDEKAMFCFNQWLTQVGQKLKVKPHLDVLEGVQN